MINYAHRGASEYAPENIMSSFYLGLLQGVNGTETDVQVTKDGVRAWGVASQDLMKKCAD